ncbi:hypothetical protein AERO9A_420029 [Aeromonas salmonicida]|nr:hypothetical protein AERO9A_420029 [Aeromonas salmonicida]
MAVSSGAGRRVSWGAGLLLLALLLPVWATPAVKPLIVANSKAWQPFSYINEEGQPDGLLIDLWREYGRVTGRPIQFKLVDWQTSLDLVRTRPMSMAACSGHRSAIRSMTMARGSPVSIPSCSLPTPCAARM